MTTWELTSKNGSEESTVSGFDSDRRRAAAGLIAAARRTIDTVTADIAEELTLALQLGGQPAAYISLMRDQHGHVDIDQAHDFVTRLESALTTDPEETHE